MHTQAPSGPRKPQNATLVSRCSGAAAAWANMVGGTKVSNTALSAGLAGPGCPMFVAQSRAVLIGLSLDGGVEPNGSFAVTCSSHLLADAAFWASGVPGSATEPGNDGKLYSLLPRTATR